MTWENGTETCMLAQAKEVTRASPMHDTGDPEPELCGVCRDGVGRELGTESRMMGTHVYL